ncbi:MAG: addiction module toxin, HicA family [Alphaproteobacteria bacterium]
MNSNQFKRWLAKQGCTFGKKSAGHIALFRGGRESQMPVHGGRKQLGKGLMAKLKKDPGLA